EDRLGYIFARLGIHIGAESMAIAIGSSFATVPQHEGERTHALTLLRIGDALRPLSDADEIMFTTCQILGEFLGANRVFYTTIVDEAIAVITRDYVNGVPSIAGEIPLAAFGAVLDTTFKRGEDLTVDDMATDPRFTVSQRAAFSSLRIA